MREGEGGAGERWKKIGGGMRDGVIGIPKNYNYNNSVESRFQKDSRGRVIDFITSHSIE